MRPSLKRQTRRLGGGIRLWAEARAERGRMSAGQLVSSINEAEVCERLFLSLQNKIEW